MTAATTQVDWFSLQRRLDEGAPAILGVGSYEQHGPHLPMATDTLIADALAGAVAAEVGGVVLPAVPYGAPSRPRSGGGDPFPAPAPRLGTLLATLEELARGAFDMGVRRLVVVAWHMENALVLWDALHAAVAGRTGVQAVLFDAPWNFLAPELEDELFPDGEPSWPKDHAGCLETAIMLHLAPDLTGDAPAPVEYRGRDEYDVLPTPADAVPSSGVANDARHVTADHGRRAIASMVAGMVGAVRAEDPGASRDASG